MKKRMFSLLLGSALLLGGCKLGQSDQLYSDSLTTSEHVCNLAIVGGYEATCQAEGSMIIGCVSCPYIQEETVLEKAECTLAENGKCKWCGQTLEDLLPWIGTLEYEFISVTQIREYYGVAPGNFKNVKTSESQADKEAMLAFLKNHSLIQITDETKTQIAGGGGVTFEIETENGTHTLTRANGFFYIDGKYYESKKALPELTDGEDCYSFVTYTGRSELYIDGEKMQVQEGLIEKIRFRETNNLEIISDSRYVLSFDGGDLDIYYSKYFRYGGVLYEVVGETDFSQFFEDDSGTDSIETLCEHCRRADESITYRNEYGANLCNSCYQEYVDNIMQACCFCGSYVCNGDCQE